MKTHEQAVRDGEQGALLASQHADSASMDWTQQASCLFVDFSKAVKKGQPFLTEDARAWAESQGLPPPPDNRAWGFIAKAMSQCGHVVSEGYAPAKSSNGSPKVLWRAA